MIEGDRIQHRQHHDEATDALIAEALRIGYALAIKNGCLISQRPPLACTCKPCRDLDTIKAALKATGK